MKSKTNRSRGRCGLADGCLQLQIPVTRAFRSSATRRFPTFHFAAEGGPGPMFPELAPWTLPRSPDAAVTAPAPASGACSKRGNPGCCSGCRRCSCCARPGAGQAPGPAAREREPPVPEDRAAQPPRVGVRRVRHPGANPLLHFAPRDAARPPAVTEAAQAVAEPPHVRLRQPSTPDRPQLEPEERRRGRRRRHVRLLRVQRQTPTREKRAKRPRHASSRAASSANNAR